MNDIAEPTPETDDGWDVTLQQAQRELSEMHRDILRRVANGTASRTDAVILAGALGFGSMFQVAEDSNPTTTEDDPE